MAEWDYIIAPHNIKVDFRFLETAIAVHSFGILNAAKDVSGFGDWIYDTYHRWGMQQRVWNDLLTDMIYGHREKSAYEMPFATFITQLEHEDASIIQQHIISVAQHHHENPISAEDALRDYASYRAFVSKLLAEKDMVIEDEEAFQYRYKLLSDPITLKHLIIAHAHQVWSNGLKAEIEANRPMLEESIEAFKPISFDNMDMFDIIESVTGRNMRHMPRFTEELKEKALSFVPSMHIGPYIGWMPLEDEVFIVYGARMPRNTQNSSVALNRSELLMRLDALADDTRLKMLKMLTLREEICAQDFITELELSQSSASRHLRQLTASGYISERRREVAKCYSLNTDRVEDTLNALRNYLDTSR